MNKEKNVLIILLLKRLNYNTKSLFNKGLQINEHVISGHIFTNNNMLEVPVAM